ncbi:MAG: PaaI family thioesterase [Ktedonobacterales bacterium]
MSDDETASQRTRTIIWEDPLPAVARARDMSGLDYLRAMLDGRIPMSPIGALVDMRLVEVGEGRAVFELKPAEFHYNPIGSVHGGIAATLLDSAMGCSVNTLLPRGVSYTTLELKVNYVRPMTRDTGIVRAEGSVIHLGGRVAVAEGRLVDAGGKLYAHATTTCLVMRG